MTDYASYKSQVLECCQALASKGYLVATGGNVSIRIEGEDALAVTPSSRDYRTMVVDDICVVGFGGQQIGGGLKPSVETAMHAAVYQHRPDANAVIHTHQPYTSVFALISQPIPALFDEQVFNLGDRVEIAPYAVSGSVDLLNNIAGRLGNQCNAYILQNHGALCLGLSMAEAERNVEILEKCARVYYYALTAGRPISELPADMAAGLFELLKAEQRKEIRRKRRAAQVSYGKTSNPGGSNGGQGNEAANA